MRTLNYGDTLIGQILSLDFSSLKFDDDLKSTIIAKSKNGSMIRCHTETNANFITIQDGSNSTVLYKRISGEDASISLTDYTCTSFDDIVYLNIDAFGYSCIKVNESVNHKPLRINIDDINTYLGKYITANTCKGTSPIRKLYGYTEQKIQNNSISTVTGTKVIVNDTYVNNQTEFTIDGNCYQKTTEGKNKFNLNYIEQSASKVVTDTGVNLINCWGTQAFDNEKVLKTFKPNTTYTMKAKAKVVSRPSTQGSHQNSTLLLYRAGSSALGLVDVGLIKMKDKETITLNTEKEYVTTFTTPADLSEVRLLSYSFYGNNNGSTTYAPSGEIDLTDIMLVEGTYTIDNFPSYEPYTGGIPSPNSDYTQKITSVGGYDNIFDKNNIISGSYVNDISGAFVSDSTSKRTDYIEIQANSYYYIYSDKTSGNWGAWYDKDKNFISGITLRADKEGTVNSPANAKYMAFTISHQGNLTDYSNIKINETAIKIKQSGKNVFDNNKISQKASLSYSNGIYSASDNDTATRLTYKIQQYDSNKKFIPSAGEIRQNIDKSGVYYFTAQKYTTTKYLRIANSGKTYEFNLYYPLDDINVGDYYTVVLNIIDTTIGASKFKDVMLLKGKITSASYEPYHEPKITSINLQGNVLSKAGDVKDILKIRKNGRVTITKTTWEDTINSSDLVALSNNNNRLAFTTSKRKITSTSDNNYLVTNAQRNRTFSDGTVYQNPIKFVFVGSQTDTLETIKAKFSGGKILYQLATHQVITLPSVSPIELWQGTNIFSLITNLDTEIKLDYNYISQSPSPEIPSEIRNIGDNINIFNKNSTFNRYQASVDVLDTGIKVTNLSTTKYASVCTNLGSTELLGKTITLHSDIEESEGATANVLLYFGNESRPTFGGVIQKINNNSKNSGLWKIPSSFPEDCDRINLYLYSGGSTEPIANSYVKYNNLKVEVRDTPSPYSDYGCGSTRITSSTENLANTEQLYNEMVSFNSKNVRKEIVDKKNCIVFTNAFYRAALGFKGLQGRYKKNTQYVVRFKARCYDTSISGSSGLFVQAYNKNGDLIGSDYHAAHRATWMQFSFVTNVNSSLDYIDFSYENLTDWCIDLDSFEIYAGTSVKAVDKNEDTDAVIQFNKGQKLMEGDYLADDGIHHIKTQIVLDGVTDGLKVSTVTKHSNDIYYCVVNLVKQSLNNTDNVNGLYCSHLMPRYGVEPGNCYIAGSGLFLVLVLTDQTLTTADAANEWLAMQKEANIPVVVEYKLAKEIIEPYKNTLPLWIDQYKNQTNIYTSDESEVEVETTSNESLANIQREIKSLYDKSKAYNSDYINNMYSTDEMKTGETWIDGKPIYRKTFVFTGITATSASLSFSSSNASETIIVDNSHSYVSTSANFSLPINMYNSSTDYIRTYVNSGDKKLFVEFGSVYTMSKNIYVTLRYTKTTD